MTFASGGEQHTSTFPGAGEPIHAKGNVHAGTRRGMPRPAMVNRSIGHLGEPGCRQQSFQRVSGLEVNDAVASLAGQNGRPYQVNAGKGASEGFIQPLRDRVA